MDYKTIFDLLEEISEMADAVIKIRETERFEYVKNMSNQKNKSNMIFQLLVELYDDKEELEKSLHEWLCAVDFGLFDEFKGTIKMSE